MNHPTHIEDAELRVEQPVEVRLVGHPEDIAVVHEALARMVPTAGLTPLRGRRAPDSRHTGNTTVVTGAGPSMTREHSTGELISRPAYAAFVEQVAKSSGGRTVEVDGALAHRAAEWLGELANRLGQNDPLARAAAADASRLWSALGI
jgi:hypothetical protein